MARGLFFSEYNNTSIHNPSLHNHRNRRRYVRWIIWGLQPSSYRCCFCGEHLRSAHAHGMLVKGISTGLSQTLGIFEETTIALLQQTFKYTGPTFFGDTIHLKLTVSLGKAFIKRWKRCRYIRL